MPVRRLPPNPNLEHLKHQAKDLLKHHAAHSGEAAQRIREFHPRFAHATDGEIFAAPLKLSDAQLTIARESGFAGWPRLKRHVEKPIDMSLPHHERIEDPIFRRAVDLIDAGDAAGLRAHLKRHPKMARQHITFEGWNYFCNPALLEFIAENPVRRGRLPNNIVEIAGVIIEAGAERSSLNETLMLVSTGRVPRECGLQIPLIDFLCDRGAEPDSAITVAIVLNEMQAAKALLARGAHLTLPIAAGLGLSGDLRNLLAGSNARERHLALALAAQFGHVEILRILLDAGEDPNRYNPPGGHSHSTPLHQAAGNGHLEAVKLLVERGARVDMKDILFQGTPAGWAEYAGRKEVEEYLRRGEANRKHE
jgi:Ankyrin repeats (3 copies)